MKYLIFITLISLVACGSVVKYSAAKVNLCDVQTNRDRYDGKLIVFRAQIGSDGLERTSLWDPKCRDFPLSVDQASGGADWTEVNKIVYEIGNIGSTDKIITADISGVFHKMPHNGKVSVMSITNLKYLMMHKY